MFCLIALFYFQNQLVKEKRFLEAFKLNNYVGMVAVFGFTLEIFFL